MSSDLYRVGRGGAGNFHSKKEKEEAEERDVEASAGVPTASSQPPAVPQPQVTPYTRGGRGGAGNYYDTAALATVMRDEAAEAARVQAATIQASAPATADNPALVNPSTTPAIRHRPGLSGRGGAGNYSVNAAAAEAEAEEDRRRKQAAIEARIQQDVEADLPMPPKTYHQAPLTRERRK